MMIKLQAKFMPSVCLSADEPHLNKIIYALRREKRAMAEEEQQEALGGDAATKGAAGAGASPEPSFASKGGSMGGSSFTNGSSTSFKRPPGTPGDSFLSREGNGAANGAGNGESFATRQRRPSMSHPAMHASPRYVPPSIPNQKMSEVLSMAEGVTKSRQRRRSFSGAIGLGPSTDSGPSLVENIERVVNAAAVNRPRAGGRHRRASFSDALRTLEGRG